MYVKDIYLNTLCKSPVFTPKIRRLMLKLYGHDISLMFSNCIMGEGPGHLKMGKGSFCNHGCFFDLSSDILIGENCSVGMNVTFVNSTHNIGNRYKRAGRGFSLPIIVEDGCWIGANSTIMPGVTIRKGCVIAAGALVVHSTEEDCLYAGLPAKKIKDL